MSAGSPLSGEKQPIIEGPFESTRVHESWFWERPNGAGDLGYNRSEILLRCARIFGGQVKVYRVVERRTTTVHHVPSPDAVAAKERVEQRATLRKEAAEAGRLLPAEYRENLRQQFERGEAEARFIVGGGEHG